MTAVTVKLNGVRQTAEVPGHTTLLVLLRDHFGLTGAKSGCEVGDCGACTVLVDGKAVNACLMLAIQAQGREVLTIEGLATREGLHPLQEAFETHGALQCGFCGPGMILSAKALLAQNAAPAEADIRTALAGNLCRCSGYTKIVEAVQAAATTLRVRRATAPGGIATHDHD